MLKVQTMLESSTESLQDKKLSNGIKRKGIKGKKREKYMPTSEPLELPFCRICGKRASGIHFGVYSCEACKAFFRRCLQRKTPFKCDKGGDCVIDEQQKGLNCSACRLKKCQDRGMSKDGIRIGRYSTAERTNVIMEVKKLHASTESAQQPSSTPNFKDTGCPSYTENLAKTQENLEIPQNSDILDQDLLIIEDPVLFADDRYLEVETSSDGSKGSPNSQSENLSTSSLSSPSSVSLIGPDSAEYLNSLVELLEASQMPSPVEPRNNLFDRDEANQVMNQLMSGYHYLQPFTKSLTDEELRDVFTHGIKQYEEKVRLFGKMQYLSIEEYRDVYKKTQIDVDGRIELYSLGRTEITKMFNEYVKFSHGIIGFSSLPPKDQAALLKAANFDFSMIIDYRAVDVEKEMMISYTGKMMPMSECCTHTPIETIKRWSELCQEIQKLHPSPQEHALMLGICMTFQDRCQLESPEKVEEIQNKMIKALVIFLQDGHKQGSGRRLAKIMDLFVRLRDMDKEFHDILEEMCKDEFVTECIPEIFLFF